ncbi:MAG: hypothetical protein HQM10_13375 [Candidatus Riflebacteria bacterium]|nr:hypothetical protein [Candidatus Riflebacteria bacterium]
MNRVCFSVLLACIFLSATFSPAFSAEMKEWTLAVYLNADNNLDPFGVEDQEEMSKIGSSDWLNIVSLIDREKGPASYNYIEKGKISKIEGMPETELDMGDYKLLVNFMSWVTKNYPAKKYALVIWNHGSGWKKAGKSATRGISYDDSSNRGITTNELSTALGEIRTNLGKNLDILTMDACLMQMAEVAYICQDKVDYIIASEDVEPGKGAPYDDILVKLSADSTPENFAKTWVAAFAASYNNGSQGYESCTQSCVKVSALPQLFDAMNGFSKSAISGKFNVEFTKALKKVKKFEDRDNIDLLHFLKLLSSSIKDESVVTSCEKLTTAYQEAVIAFSNIDDQNENAFGLAVYFPLSSHAFDNEYEKLDFSSSVKWGEMVQDFYRKNAADKAVHNAGRGRLDDLRRFVSSATSREKDINRHVAQQLNFKFFSEKASSSESSDELKKLVSELLAK